MKIVSFYKIYYQHRFLKANFFLKIYLSIVLIIRFYLHYIFFFFSKKDLEVISKYNNSLFKKNINYLFSYFNTDKANYLNENQYDKALFSKYKIDGNSYSKFYEKYFRKKKYLIKNILEVGCFKGNCLASFYFYFPNATLHGADIFPDIVKYKSNSRFKKYFVDCSKKSSILLLSKKIPNLDIIIEDASHYFKDQIFTFFSLFKKLNSKGIFVIEELDFPDKRLDSNINNEHPTLKEILMQAKTNKDFSSPYIKKNEKIYFLKNVDSIEIYKGRYHEICFIKKK